MGIAWIYQREKTLRTRGGRSGIARVKNFRLLRWMITLLDDHKRSAKNETTSHF